MSASGAGVESNGLLIEIAIFAIVAIGLFVLFAIIKKKRTEQISEVKEKFNVKDILFSDNSANFFGQKSNGISQVRGNGILLVTEHEIYFSLLMPRKEVCIPVKQIIAITSETSFLGKSKFKPLLVIQFKDRAGNLDSAAWLIRDLSSCTTTIHKLIAPSI